MDDVELKATLYKAISGPGGLPDVLYTLRDLCLELAENEGDVVDNPTKAAAWEKVARTLNRAAGQAVPLLDIY